MTAPKARPRSLTAAAVEAGVPLLARMVAGTTHLYTLLPIIEASDVTGHDPAQVAKAFFAVGSSLDLTWYLQEISNLPVENNWQALAREAFATTSTCNSERSPSLCCRWPMHRKTWTPVSHCGVNSTG